MSEAGSEQGWGCPDISGTAASQEEKKTGVLQFAFVKVWRKGKGKRPFFFFQHHIPVFFFSLENILVLVLSSLETKELNGTEEVRSGKEVLEV